MFQRRLAVGDQTRLSDGHDARMGTEDLFDQRRSGTEEAKHEDRLRPFASNILQSSWVVSGTRIFDGDSPKLGPDG